MNNNIKAPIFVIIISWLILIGGALGLLGGLLGGAVGLLGASSLIAGLGILSIIINAGWVVSSFGIRKMKKWGLYLFTILTVLHIGMSFLGSNASMLAIVIEALILVYFWSMREKFA